MSTRKTQSSIQFKDDKKQYVKRKRNKDINLQDTIDKINKLRKDALRDLNILKRKEPSTNLIHLIATKLRFYEKQIYNLNESIRKQLKEDLIDRFSALHSNIIENIESKQIKIIKEKLLNGWIFKGGYHGVYWCVKEFEDKIQFLKLQDAFVHWGKLFHPDKDDWEKRYEMKKNGWLIGYRTIYNKELDWIKNKTEIIEEMRWDLGLDEDTHKAYLKQVIKDKWIQMSRIDRAFKLISKSPLFYSWKKTLKEAIIEGMKLPTL